MIFRRTTFWIISALFLGIIAPNLSAQYASIGGLVRLDGEYWPAPGVNVVLSSESGLRLGAVSDSDGEFLFSRLSPGNYVLKSSFVGYKSRIDSLNVVFGDEKRLELTLFGGTEALESVEVFAEGSRNRITSAGVRSITPGDLDRIPTPDVSGDLMSALLTMPGVTSSGDRGGQLFVRGGTPTQNLVMIDGIPVYQPFHILGFYSAFPSDVISYADVYAGGFSAQYGGRLSSVIDVASRNGDKKDFKAGVSMAPFLSSIRLEGPISKGKVSFLASARESVIERLGSGLINQELPYRFGDQLFKAHAYLNQTSSASFTFLRSFDEGNLGNVSDETTRTKWTNSAVGAKYFFLPADFPVVTELSVSHSELNNEFGPAGFADRYSSVSGTNASIRFLYLLGETEFRLGIFTRSLSFRYQLPEQLPFKEFITEGGIFAEGEFKLGPDLLINTGVRIHGFPSRSYISVEPRLRMEYQTKDGPLSQHLFSIATGLYRQEVVGIADRRDVANVFTVWSTTPVFEGIPQAIHFIGAWSANLFPWLNTGIEVYRKSLENLIMPSDPLLRQQGSGTASGIEFRAEVIKPSVYMFASYSLGSVWYNPNDEGYQFSGGQSGTDSFRPPHDRRHIMNLIGRYTKGNYSVALRFQYGSGLPFTQVSGFFNNISPIQTNQGFHTIDGENRLVFGEPFKGRLPAYHSLDVTLERRFRFNQMKGKFLAGLINAYNRGNLFYYDVWNNERINQLPIVPTLGLKIDID